MESASLERRIRFGLIAVLAATAIFTAFAMSPGTPGGEAKPAAAATKTGVLKGWPSRKRLATEFLRLLKNEDVPGLRRFLDPAFLLQRGDGSYLTKSEYLKDPSAVYAFQVRNIVATHNGDVRVIRFEAKTDQIVNGNQVPGVWIPRLSTFKKTGKVWRLIAHANFLPPTT
ncbi:MAG: nuclear transport factor 2 family protein [Solirubrobacterales bacterium]|nr:nuclear transport factor 2 family protein [Solirubrobacterales bacterium]MCB0863068.1 nuclear transport factor 2 family protein [Solirubrobacterales bacterium]MCB8915639.1 nuclear transport factor 2 family protein [Thermoleophilales bacterium]